MKNITSALLAAAIGLLGLAASADETPAGIQEIPPESAHEEITASEGVVLVDLYADW